MPIQKKMMLHLQNSVKVEKKFCSLFGYFQDYVSTSLWNWTVDKDNNVTLFQTFEITLFLKWDFQIAEC